MKSKSSDIIKMVIASAAVISLCGGLFVFANTQITAAEFNKTEEIPTEYYTPPVFSTTEAEADTDGGAETADGITAPDYTITELPENPAVRDAKAQPSFANAISRELAAEAGAKYIREYFGESVAGKYFDMFYFVGPDTLRANWCIYVYSSPNYRDEYIMDDFTLTVDAITAEVVQISRGYSAPENAEYRLYNIKETEDNFRANCDEYLEMAKAAAESHLKTKAVSVEFAGLVFSGEPRAEEITQEEARQEERERRWRLESGEVYGHLHYVQVMVTDEYGTQCEIRIDIDTKKIHDILRLVPADPNGVIGVG